MPTSSGDFRSFKTLKAEQRQVTRLLLWLHFEASGPLGCGGSKLSSWQCIRPGHFQHITVHGCPRSLSANFAGFTEGAPSMTSSTSSIISTEESPLLEAKDSHITVASHFITHTCYIWVPCRSLLSKELLAHANHIKIIAFDW